MLVTRWIDLSCLFSRNFHLRMEQYETVNHIVSLLCVGMSHWKVGMLVGMTFRRASSIEVMVDFLSALMKFELQLKEQAELWVKCTT